MTTEQNTSRAGALPRTSNLARLRAARILKPGWRRGLVAALLVLALPFGIEAGAPRSLLHALGAAQTPLLAATSIVAVISAWVALCAVLALWRGPWARLAGMVGVWVLALLVSLGGHVGAESQALASAIQATEVR